MLRVHSIFRLSFLINSSWKISFSPRTKHTVIAGLILLGSAVFCEIGAVLVVCYSLMRGWYGDLQGGNSPLTLNAGLKHVCFVTFLSFISKRVPMDPFWDTDRSIGTFSIEQYNSLRFMRICSRTVSSLGRTYTSWA